jgi:hypothetical protein
LLATLKIDKNDDVDYKGQTGGRIVVVPDNFRPNHYGIRCVRKTITELSCGDFIDFREDIEYWWRTRLPWDGNRVGALSAREEECRRIAGRRRSSLRISMKDSKA